MSSKSSFRLQFTSSNHYFEFQEQLIASSSTVLVGGRDYSISGDSLQIEWIKEKIPELKLHANISLQDLKERFSSLELEDTNEDTIRETHSVVLERTGIQTVNSKQVVNVNNAEHFNAPHILRVSNAIVNTLNKDMIYTASLDQQATTKLEKELLNALPSYGSSFHDELSVVKQVINEQLGINEFFLREFSEGGSGAKVYGVYIPDGSLRYVIKTMEGKTFELARELSSLKQLSDLDLQQSTFPSVQTAGKFNVESRRSTHTIFIQTAAKGKTFSTLIEEAGESEKQDRTTKLKTLKEGLTKAAKGLAELHLKNNHLATPLGEDSEEFNLAALTEVYDWVKSALKEGGRIKLTQGELELVYKNSIEAVGGNWGLSGYSHGDTHLDNLFFDPHSGQCTFIDTPSFLASVDTQGNPIGFPAYDFAWAWGSISEKGFRAGLSAEEVEELQGVFKSQYEIAMGSALPPLPARQFAALKKHFYFIGLANQRQEYLLDHAHKIDHANMQKQFEALQCLIDHHVKAVKTISNI